MEDDIQNYLSTVMFRGTPCSILIIQYTVKYMIFFLNVLSLNTVNKLKL